VRTKEITATDIVTFLLLTESLDMGRGSRRLYHMSLHFFLSHFSPTLILARFGQAEDGAHSFFVITFLPYSSLLSAGQLPIVSFDELEDFFSP
jgi:hypothetical protein